MTSSLNISQRRKRDLRRLGLYLVGIVLTAPFIGLTLDAAWATRGLTYHGAWRVLGILGMDPYALIMFTSGLYVGWLLLLWTDSLKRRQAALLTVATVVFVGALLLSGRWTDPARAVANLPSLLGGVLLGVLLGGGTRLLTNDGPYEFRRAANQLFGFTALVVVIGLVERHVVYRSPLRGFGELYQPGSLGLTVAEPFWIVVNLVATGAFLILLHQFVQYEARQSIVVLGPPESGKTSFVVGLYDRARSQSKDRKTFDVDQALAEAHWQFKQDGFDGLRSTAQETLTQYQFTYTGSGMFPQHVTVSAPDYSGRLSLSDLVDAYRRTDSARSGLGKRLGITAPDQPSVDNRVRDVQTREAGELLARYAAAADLLVLVVPARDFVVSDTSVRAGELPEYFGEADTVDPEGYISQLTELAEQRGAPEVLLVTSMSDLYVQSYEREFSPGTFADQHYENAPGSNRSFRSYITSRHRVTEASFDQLLGACSEQNTYPFYYRMDPESDEPKPAHLLESSGTFDTVGSEAVLDRIQR